MLDVLVTSILSVKVKGIEAVFFGTLAIAIFLLSVFVYARIYFIIRRLVRSKLHPSHGSRSKKKKISSGHKTRKTMLLMRHALYVLHDTIFARTHYFAQTRQTNIPRFCCLVNRVCQFEFYFQFFDILLDEEVNENKGDQNRQGYLEVTKKFVRWVITSPEILSVASAVVGQWLQPRILNFNMAATRKREMQTHEGFYQS